MSWGRAAEAQARQLKSLEEGKCGDPLKAQRAALPPCPQALTQLLRRETRHPQSRLRSAKTEVVFFMLLPGPSEGPLLPRSPGGGLPPAVFL